MPATNTTRRILRRPEVEARVGHKRSWIYDQMEANRFPRPVEIGMGSVGWFEDEIDEWVNTRPRRVPKQRDS